MSREPELTGKTVVVIGASSGIGLATAQRARSEGAGLILAARNPEHLAQAASDLDPLGTAAFDATDPVRLASFFEGLPEPVDHVMVTAGGPYYGRLEEMDFDQARRAFDDHLWLAFRLARQAAPRMRPGGTLLFMTGIEANGAGEGVASSLSAALKAAIANLALELAPVRANLIVAGFVDSPLSASLLGGELEKRREQLRATLPIGRVVGPADVAALAVHLMINTAITGGSFEIDGGQQLIGGS